MAPPLSVMRILRFHAALSHRTTAAGSLQARVASRAAWATPLGQRAGLSDRIVQRWAAGGPGIGLLRWPLAERERSELEFPLSRAPMPTASWLGVAPPEPEPAEPLSLAPLSPSFQPPPVLAPARLPAPARAMPAAAPVSRSLAPPSVGDPPGASVRGPAARSSSVARAIDASSAERTASPAPGTPPAPGPERPEPAPAAGALQALTAGATLARRVAGAHRPPTLNRYMPPVTEAAPAAASPDAGTLMGLRGEPFRPSLSLARVLRATGEAPETLGTAPLSAGPGASLPATGPPPAPAGRPQPLLVERRSTTITRQPDAAVQGAAAFPAVLALSSPPAAASAQPLVHAAVARAVAFRGALQAVARTGAAGVPGAPLMAPSAEAEAVGASAASPAALSAVPSAGLEILTRGPGALARRPAAAFVSPSPAFSTVHGATAAGAVPPLALAAAERWLSPVPARAASGTPMLARAPVTGEQAVLPPARAAATAPAILRAQLATAVGRTAVPETAAETSRAVAAAPLLLLRPASSGHQRVSRSHSFDPVRVDPALTDPGAPLHADPAAPGLLSRGGRAPAAGRISAGLVSRAAPSRMLSRLPLLAWLVPATAREGAAGEAAAPAGAAGATEPVVASTPSMASRRAVHRSLLALPGTAESPGSGVVAGSTPAMPFVSRQSLTVTRAWEAPAWREAAPAAVDHTLMGEAGALSPAHRVPMLSARLEPPLSRAVVSRLGAAPGEAPAPVSAGTTAGASLIAPAGARGWATASEAPMLARVPRLAAAGDVAVAAGPHSPEAAGSPPPRGSSGVPKGVREPQQPRPASDLLHRMPALAAPRAWPFLAARVEPGAQSQSGDGSLVTAARFRAPAGSVLTRSAMPGVEAGTGTAAPVLALAAAPRESDTLSARAPEMRYPALPAAVARQAVAGGAAQGTESPAPSSSLPVLESGQGAEPGGDGKETEAGQIDRLAHEVWLLLKRRVLVEAERMGRW